MGREAGGGSKWTALDEYGTRSSRQQPYPQKNELVSKVKNMQRTDSMFREAWDQHCDVVGNGLKDPAKYDDQFLQDAISRLPKSKKQDTSAPVNLKEITDTINSINSAVPQITPAAIQLAAGVLSGQGQSADINQLAVLAGLLTAANPSMQKAGDKTNWEEQKPQKPKAVKVCDTLKKFGQSYGIDFYALRRLQEHTQSVRHEVMMSVKANNDPLLSNTQLVMKMCKQVENGQPLSKNTETSKVPYCPQAASTDVRQCRKGHKLEPKNHYREKCEICLENDGVWECDLCRYFVCNGCIEGRQIKEMTVTPALVGLLIGTGGSNLKRLQKKVVGAVFRIPKKEELPDTPVRVIGKPDDLHKAFAAMNEMITQFGEMGQTGNAPKPGFEFPIGSLVRVSGLQEATNLNNEIGRVTGYGKVDQTGRVMVSFNDPQYGERLLKPINLSLVN
eukprot:TRINITY_DN2930_c0_g2_i6.p1 TRINITY_DN2930_c0_g2~~TRINITY_DN2930_c0_g2_i6.p1  ORF type:complete len:447 (+),score=118.23 TRINITY_DN2930_c0_g2_i6:867-2207(+)